MAKGEKEKEKLNDLLKAMQQLISPKETEKESKPQSEKK